MTLPMQPVLYEPTNMPAQAGRIHDEANVVVDCHDQSKTATDELLIDVMCRGPS